MMYTEVRSWIKAALLELTTDGDAEYAGVGPHGPTAPVGLVWPITGEDSPASNATVTGTLSA